MHTLCEGEDNIEYLRTEEEVADSSQQISHGGSQEEMVDSSIKGIPHSIVLEDKAYGDSLGLRQEQILHMGHININGIPKLRDDEKNTRIRQAIDEHPLDIIRISGTNRCWHLLDERKQMEGVV